MTLREVLHAHIPLLTEQSTLRDAVDRMDVYQFPGLVLIDDDRRPIAVITEGDICRAVTGQENLSSLQNQPAIQFATLQPSVASVEMEVSEAMHWMLSSGLTLLPVVEEGRLMGIVLRMDLMQAILVDSGAGRESFA